MSALDWSVLAAYVAIVAWIGMRAARGQGDTERYFVGNRQLPWLAAGVSIVATSFSAASILGVPGLAFAGDLWYLQLQLGDLLAALLVCALFIPFFHRLRLTSAYEYLEARFDLPTRLLGSALFMATVLVRAGTLLYGAALLFEQIGPRNLLPGLSPVEEAIAIFGAVAILYTVAGGIGAVVWTDVLQFAVMAAGILSSLALVSKSLPDGLAGALEAARGTGKLQLVHLDPQAPFAAHGLITATFGYGVLALSLFGANQQPVQRYMSVRNARSAKRALLLGVVSGALGVALSLLFGLALWAHYQQQPGLLPPGLSADQVAPHFIRTEVPNVLKGLLVAAVFAAAMSSLDSALNSLAAAFVTDVFARVFVPGASERMKLRVARAVVIAAGTIAIGVGFEAAARKAQIIRLILEFMGYFAGGILGLFMLGMLSRRANGRGAILGAPLGTFTVCTLVKTPPFGLPALAPALGMAPLPFLWTSALALAITLLVGLLASLPFAAPEPNQLEHTIWRSRKRNHPLSNSSGTTTSQRSGNEVSS